MTLIKHRLKKYIKNSLEIIGRLKKFKFEIFPKTVKNAVFDGNTAENGKKFDVDQALEK